MAKLVWESKVSSHLFFYFDWGLIYIQQNLPILNLSFNDF